MHNNHFCKFYHPFHHHNNLYSTGVLVSSSDSSDVEIEEIFPESLPVRGVARGGNRRRGGRSEAIGEGTSRGPGELGSNFNSSRQNKKTIHKQQQNKKQYTSNKKQNSWHLIEIHFQGR